MYWRTLLFGAAVVLLGAALASAEPFVSPPESDPMVPPGGWTTVFPYPRNVLIDFATDPAAWPPDPTGPPGSLDMIPDVNYVLEGDDDPRLYPSDWGQGFGDYDWIDTDPRFPGRQGLAGIDNRQGWTVSATLHLDNEPEPRPVKHLWIEMEYYFDAGGWQTSMDPAYTDIRFKSEVLPDGWRRRTWWFEIEPNPPWEELTIGIETSELGPGTVLFDYVHIATECVPEPGSLALLGAGVLGLLCCFRRGRRRDK